MGSIIGRTSAWRPALTSLGLAACVCLALGKIHLRVQTTLVGYEIGRLKTNESKLLEERAFLKMQLAKLTTKKHLTLISDTEGQETHRAGTYALK